MKSLAKVLSVSVVLAVVAGCASNDVVYIPKVPTPAEAKLLDYFDQPNNKVFLLAVDPSGDFSFGYDYGKATVKEALKVATEKCDANREAHGIVAKPYIYAINDDVVYEEMIMKDHQRKKEKVVQDEAEVEVEVVEMDQPVE
ncbi:hypothetical protein [Pontiella sulfatireligans]|uniref:Lipoprotein n=1 Tax=Pontiella sulfatireligans TaxID=2750658 RepID=A0A6C2UQA4_9BACT|nr:hypothetical protein [Pontiella sulfatireligans]VGO21484.1 hypothetical protein SCARR_03558 [Pontiella sulfatireligans]